MRLLIITLSLFLALPAAAQDKACRGMQNFDLGDGSKGCIVVIKEGAITTNYTRDDGASSQTRRNVQPFVGAVMSGDYSEKRSVNKRRLLSLCKIALADVQAQFADTKYNRIMLAMDWRGSGEGVQSGFSNKKCSGFQFFDG